jgi:hypothetical protein
MKPCDNSLDRYRWQKSLKAQLSKKDGIEVISAQQIAV